MFDHLFGSEGKAERQTSGSGREKDEVASPRAGRRSKMREEK